ncbi:MAG: metallophosphoesterase [Clostridia bacterium]|nr:metallophosphoesterase [Clostridia bacterium]
MKILQKSPNKDFVILNLSDPQMNDGEWGEGHPYRSVLEYTIKELVARHNPDLITVTGDMAYPGHYHSYEMLAQLLDSFGVPWTIVWGNHDHQDGIEPILQAAALFKKHPLCLFEDGDPAYGNGNYILAVNEGDTPITALFMLDSHNSIEFTNENGEKKWAYAKLWPEQLAWIGEQAGKLKDNGYKDGLMMLHIPLYAYRVAAKTVFTDGRCGHVDGYGDLNEPICSHPTEDGVLATIKESGLITHVLAGHDHCNDFMIPYEGVEMMFACKTGPGCYWMPSINGGTVITIGETGIKEARHAFVDVTHLIEGTSIGRFEPDFERQIL